MKLFLVRVSDAFAIGILRGLGEAICVSGLLTFFWMLMPPVRLGMERPFTNIPVFDAALLIGTPIVSFVVLSALEFWLIWKEFPTKRSRLYHHLARR